MAEYQILYWRDMPAQIRVYDNGRPKSFELPGAFLQEIDRVAMQEELVNTDSYLEQWVWSDKENREGTVEETAAAVIEELTRSE